MAGNLGDLIVRVGADISGFASSMSTVSGQLSAVDKEAQKAGAGFTRIGQTLTGIGTGISAAVTLPILGAGIAATKFATDFDLGMRQVTSLVGGATQKEFADLSAATLRLAKDMGIDAVGATRALYEAISAGIPKENALDFVAVASKAAIAGLTDTKISVNALTTMIAAYGLKTSEAAKLADAMFQAVNIGKFQFADLAAAIGPAAQMASTLGISYQELLGATATLSISAGSAGVAVTQVESAMRSLLNPTKEMQAAFDQIGVASGSAAIKTYGFEGTLQKLREATGGNVEAFNALFGRIEGSVGAMGLTGDKAATAAKDLDTMRHASDGLGASTVAFNEINKSTQRQLEINLNNLKSTAIELGTSLLPAVNNLLTASKPLLEVLASMVTWFTTLPSGIQTTAIGVAAVVAAIGPLVVIAGQASIAIGGTAKAIALIPAAASLVSVSFTGLAASIGSVSVALQSGLIGALTAGELALLGVSSAVAALGSALAGMKLGVWIADLEIANNTLRSFRDMIFGVDSNAQALAKKGLAEAEASAEKLRLKLAAVGVVVERGSMTIDQYSRALLAAAAQHGKTTDSTDKLNTARKAAEEATKGLKAEEQALVATQKYEAEQLKTLAGWQEIEDKKASALAKSLETLYRNAAQSARDEKALAEESAALDARMRGLGDGSVPGLTASLKDFFSELDQANLAASGINRLGDAYKLLGITTSASLQDAAKKAQQAYSDIAGYGGSSAYDVQQAWVKSIEAQKAAVVASGEVWSEDQEKRLEMARAGLETYTADTKKGVAEQKTAWDDLGSSISTIITNTAQSISKALWDGDLSFGEKMKTMLKSIGEAVTSYFLEPATKAITKFVTETLIDLLSGKGFGSVLQNVKDLGKSISDIFTTISGTAASTAGGVASTAGGVASSGGSAAGGAGSAVSGGLTGWLGAIGSLGSMVSGIVGNFQNARQENTLNAIELNTRILSMFYMASGGIMDKFTELWGWVGDMHTGLQILVDRSLKPYDIMDGLDRMETLMRNDLVPDLKAMREAGSAPPVSVNIAGNVIGNTSFADEIATIIYNKLKLQGAVA
jgi:TP901 family phage tail tape measure protein